MRAKVVKRIRKIAKVFTKNMPRVVYDVVHDKCLRKIFNKETEQVEERVVSIPRIVLIPTCGKRMEKNMKNAWNNRHLSY